MRQPGLGLHDAELKDVVLWSPAVLGVRVEANVLPSLAALQSRLRLSDAELNIVVLRMATVLGYSVETNLFPKIDFLQRELGLSDETLRERVLDKPVMINRRFTRLQSRSPVKAAD